MSKRAPDMTAADNSADTLERVMEADGFSKWGSPSTAELLELDNGLDILESLVPTVIELGNRHVCL
ncbi:hypothetical protein BJX76DRAFT_358264 [Aspergillus varians]